MGAAKCGKICQLEARQISLKGVLKAFAGFGLSQGQYQRYQEPLVLVPENGGERVLQ